MGIVNQPPPILIILIIHKTVVTVMNQVEFAAREMEHIIRLVTISSYQAQLAYWAQLPAGTSFDETTALPASLQEGKKSYWGLWEAE